MSELKSAEAIKEMEKTVICLFLELPESVAKDVQQRWDNLKLAMASREAEIREDQRKKCAALISHSLSLANAVRNAGKEKEDE